MVSLFDHNKNYLKYIPDEIKGMIFEELSELKEQIRLSYELFIDGEKKFCKSDSIDYELRQSEYAFSLILADYITSMQRMEKSVESILELYK